jgi:hypothetical protein
MPVAVTTHLPSLPAAAYDAIASQQADALRAAPGFVAHAAYVSESGVTVVETWARREDWRSFFDANVRPQLSPGLPEPTVEDVHNVIAR